MAPIIPTAATGIVRLLGGALAAMLLAVAASWWNAREIARAVREVDGSHRILYELEATLAHAVSIQSGARGFSLTGDERYLAPYTAGVASIKQSIARLRAMTADDHRQQARLHRLSGLVDEEISIMQGRLAKRRAGGLIEASAAAADGRGKQVVEAIRGAVAALQGEERRMLDAQTAETRRAGNLALGIITGLSAIAAGLVAAALRQLPR